MHVKPDMTYQEILDQVAREIQRANTIHPPRFASPMEAFGVIREEYLEVEQEFMKSSRNPRLNSRLMKELIQLGAMCIKAVKSCCIEETGDKDDGVYVVITERDTRRPDDPLNKAIVFEQNIAKGQATLEKVRERALGFGGAYGVASIARLQVVETIGPDDRF